MRGSIARFIMITVLAFLVCPAAGAYGEERVMESAKKNTAAVFVAKELAAGRRPNRLIKEKSPYLLQHAFNPVDWNPWGEEAFATARKENKPIFLSIGYSTCHWCHVMERESFEDPALAAILNRNFVCIKVDREERPDLDQIYMAVTQAMTGSGGWPMSVFLTPDLTPFYAGTYFPPKGADGRPGFPDLLETIHNAWQKDRDSIVKQAAVLVQRLSEAQTDSEKEGKVDDGIAAAAVSQLTRGYDLKNGGFGGAPKFPRPVSMSFLLRYGKRSGDGQILDMVCESLRKMAAGGVSDQLAGGFHRYSVDAAWRVPHFEKMLYDQAQLVVLYLEAAQLSHDPFFKEVAARTLDYALGSMRDGDGAFCSAEDADSPLPEDQTKHGEGAYYLWTDQEVGKILGADEARMIRFRFGIAAKGNAPDDPHGDFRGKNILYLAKSLSETAKEFETDETHVQTILAEAVKKMLAARGTRPRPHLDDKVLTSWNGLMLSALAKGYLVLGQQRYLAAAEQVAVFLRDRMVDSASGNLWRRFRDGDIGIAGLLEDYAFTVQGLLDLYEASFDWQWLELALKLTERQIDLFEDDKQGGFFETSGKDKSVIMRIKVDYDGAEPAGNSVSALNLFRLGRFVGSEDLLVKAEKTMQAFASPLRQSPGALPQMFVAYEFKRQKPMQVVIAGDKGAADTLALQRVVADLFLPNKVMMLTDGSRLPPTLADKMPMLGFMTRQAGKATAYVCENFACQQPTTEPQALLKMLIK